MKLDEYASSVATTKARRSRCLTCKLDPKLLAQVHEARALDKPVSYSTISDWLKNDQGISILSVTIRNHFSLGHHES